MELFICLFLIAIAGTLLGLKGYSLFQRAHFDSTVQKLRNSLKECRELACLHNEDVVFSLQKKDRETVVLKGFEGGILKQETYPRLSFSFNGKEKEILTIHFCASSSINPLGKLTLFSDSYQKELDLEIFFQWSEKSD